MMTIPKVLIPFLFRPLTPDMQAYFALLPVRFPNMFTDADKRIITRAVQGIPYQP